jgi:hypothetical protein
MARALAEYMAATDARACQMPDGQWIDSPTGKPWMAANVEEAEAQVEAAEVAEHLKEECMESMRRVMESVEEVFAAERANQVGKVRGIRRDG